MPAIGGMQALFGHGPLGPIAHQLKLHLADIMSLGLRSQPVFDLLFVGALTFT
jgi:hypothetical protein